MKVAPVIVDVVSPAVVTLDWSVAILKETLSLDVFVTSNKAVVNAPLYLFAPPAFDVVLPAIILEELKLSSEPFIITS